MRLNPLKSIFLGIVVFALIFLIFLLLIKEKTINLLLLSPFFLGGLITMYFARERKLQYLFYEVILLFISSSIILTVIYPTQPRLSILGFIYLFLLIFIFTGVGGLIGKKLVDIKEENKVWSFNPIISITLGLIVSYIIFTLLFNLTLLGALYSVFHQIFTLEEVCSFVIGGFIATYFAKEKKIQYGIYLGIIWVLIELIPSLIFSGLPTSLLGLITRFLMYSVFIIAAITGSYLAISIAKHQKTKHII